MSKSPAHVFALIPAVSDDAVILRRGPTDWVAAYQCNVKTDEIVLSQWLKGRIYEHLSDVSADGRYFVYSARKKTDGYTVIALAPWLKAIALWWNVGSQGGGIFVGDRCMLHETCFNEFFDDRLHCIEQDSDYLRHGVYHARLLRDGWKVAEQSDFKNDRYLYTCDIGNGRFLQKMVHRYKSGERHRLISPSGAIDKPEWYWCDYRDGQLLWSEKGSLYRAAWDAIGSPTLIRDFNPDRFEQRRAPY